MEEQIGHYKIISELGRGGMGVVYKAHEESLNRFVALKVLGRHLSDDDSFVQRFKREAQSAAALNHPNIVQVYSIDEFEGQHCFAMEYVQGTSIQRMLKSEGAIEPVAAARLILQTAAGLGAAHEKGIFHRDIKPANLMLDERGLVKIADFGLALLSAGTTRLTATGMFMGTPGYLSPEQCLDQGIDQRTDIYSLGVTLYEMLTGVIPLNADSPLALLRQIIDVEPRDVGELRPEVPEALRQILRKMMAKKPDDRYTDCGSLIDDLQSWLATTTSTDSDLNPAIVASASVPVTEASSDATVLMDSNSMDVGVNDDMPRVAVKRKPTAAIIGLVSILLLAGVSYAAWHFGVVGSKNDPVTDASEETEVFLEEGGGGKIESAVNQSASIETADSDVAPQTAMLNPPSVQPTGDDLQEFQEQADETLSEPLQDIQTEYPGDSVKFVPEGNKDTDLYSDTAIAVVTPVEDSINNELDQVVIGEQQQLAAVEHAGTSSSQAPAVVTIGTGVALISIGDALLADAAADYVRQLLGRHGIEVFNGMNFPGVSKLLENGGGSIQELLRPHARYLVFIRADFSGERELYYMGRYDTEYQARLNLETHDMLDGQIVGSPIHASIGYTQLSVNSKVENLIRPKFGPIAGDLKE